MKTAFFTPVKLDHFFKASPQAVFDAWTNPDTIRQWMFKHDKNEIVKVECDFREAGRFSIVERGKNGDSIDHFGYYQTIASPSMLAFRMKEPKQSPDTSTVTVNIESYKGGSLMNFRQTGVDPALVENAWQQMFQKLERIVDGK